MKHFLITRFNIKNKHWKVTKNGQQILSERWLENRLQLFETYCLPSVKNQTNQNFLWCIFFDTETPSIYKEKIQNLANNYKNVQPLFVNGFGTLQSTLCEFINDTLDEKDAYIVTTRLDNDDLIHKDFIETIQSLFIQKDKTLIDLEKGYQAIIHQSKIDLRKYTTRNNPFISLVESKENYQTVISKEHQEWEKLTHPIIYNTKALWVQLIHEDNLLNDKIIALKKVSNISMEAFGMDKEMFNTGNRFPSLYNTVMIPYRIYYYSKLYLKKIVLKK